MREYNGELAGRSIKLAANFQASIAIAKDVGDPLLIAREANLEATFVSAGIAYDPKWKFTVENVPLIIWIGAKAAGENYTLPEIQDLVFEAGFPKARDLAVEYLGIIVGPGPTKEPEGDGDKEGN